MSTFDSSPNGLEIAIIGMSGRFPGAANVERLWQNLRAGLESLTFFSDAELAAAGIEATVYQAPNYVRANRILENIEFFDAAFFGYNPREVELMDPQQRLFLECAHEALENAGYDAERYPGAIGVYAGVGMNSYLANNLMANPAALGAAISLPTAIGNDKDFLSTRVSYKLNLRGPALSVQTACSTSLVATHLACQSLLNGECDMALAGGVLVLVPHKAGYLYHEGGTYSPDGHCRAFDANANGTAGGSGGAIVVLKRLPDALAAGDRIVAVIKGSAINNDGSDKVGFTAPSVNGQARVITEALTIAGVEPETVSYIETHGTGTHLGDPIEVAALTQAFRSRTDKKNFCAIGSVKTNLGHLDAAAGVTGLIKTALALQHQELPPSLHFEAPNPKIDFANSPFYVNAKLADWKADPFPRRAGVSSFGIGGTNAHVVVEEAPAAELSSISRSHQLLVLSAKTNTALENAAANLAAHLQQHPDLDLADAAFTLQAGRRLFNHRRFAVCQNVNDAIVALQTADPKRVFSRLQGDGESAVAFMFPGQGAQYVNMGLALYQSEPVFREHVDHGCELLAPHLGFDLRQVLYPPAGEEENAAQRLKQTYLTQPALFVIEHALAQLWMSWGVKPQAMIGHSIGEYVAACLAGVFSFEDALLLVAKRGQLMQNLPRDKRGAMLAVPLPFEKVETMLNGKLALAAVNEPSSCVVSGPVEAVNEFEAQLAAQALSARRLQTSHAFHSAMMDEILETFAATVRRIKLNAPAIPYLSNLTGHCITAQEATDPDYYAKHLRQTVRFAAGVKELLREPNRVLLEVGPGRTLSTLAEAQRDKKGSQIIISSLRHPQDQQADTAVLLNAFGKLWLAGVEIDWAGFYANERRHRLALPTYPFERKRFWIEPLKSGATRHDGLRKKIDLTDWFYLPSWQRVDLTATLDLEKLPEQKSRWLILTDTTGLGAALIKRLRHGGHEVFAVTAGENFSRLDDHVYAVNPQREGDYEALLNELARRDKMPERLVYLWSVSKIESFQFHDFYNLLHLAKALGKQNLHKSPAITVVTNNIHEVTGDEDLSPEKATVLGPCRVIPQEYPGLKCRNLDFVFPATEIWSAKTVEQFLAELISTASSEVVAYRGAHRWVQTFAPAPLPTQKELPKKLRRGGVYLITGGLGGIGLVLAEYLAQSVQAKLILTGRSALPKREDWNEWLATHDEQNKVSRKIRKVLALENLGAEVLAVSVDVVDAQQMGMLVAQAYQKFGALHGVIHAAGIMDENAFRVIGEISREDCERHFQPKAHGLLSLEKVLAGKEIDFCVLLSSLSSVLGGIGYVAYAAANIFMDALAQRHNRTSSVPWISVNWDGWNLKEDKNEKIEKKTMVDGAASAEQHLVITPEEGVQALQRILAMAPVSQLVVSTGDLQARIERWIKLASLNEKEEAPPEQAATLHHRPELQSAYAAPRNEAEQTIAAIWQQLLGIAQVGIADNFFDLGGHSLLAIQVISRLRQAFQIELSVQTIFNMPTVAELAAHIQKTHRPAGADAEKFARLLEMIEKASEEELKILLAEKKEALK